ncbi:MAG TPA: acetate--CoA ligase [Desulfomonilaceae bacterium]|nr:acetate--CoA ligase [Desulfomonilaceae bacterium]
MPKASEQYDAHLDAYRKTAYINSPDMYKELYERSLNTPEEFWAEQAERYLSWMKKWDAVVESDFEEARVKWFSGGVLNAAYNCLDRHIEKLKNKPAYHWEGDGPNRSYTATYLELYEKVNMLAAFLQSRGVKRGDRVIIFMPMVLELPVAMLACARIGAVHCVVHSGFGPTAVAYRIQNSRAKVVITADGGFRAGKPSPLKSRIDAVLESCTSVELVIVLKHTGEAVRLNAPKEVWWHNAIADPALPSYVAPEPMDAEDPLFILYTSASAGRPVGLVHTHGGYLLYASMTARLVFDLKDEETFWITEDLAWIPGHSYGVYGPLLNGLTSVIFEGAPGYSDHGRLWEIVAKHKVDKFCTRPSTIRSLARHAPDCTDGHDMNSLKLLGFIGETVGREEWKWYYERVGKGRCPIINAYSLAEAGGILIAPFPAVAPLRIGACSLPFFGVKPVLLDPDTGTEVQFPGGEGVLCIQRAWPGMARTVFGSHERFIEDKFSRVPGLFFTGDGAKKEGDGQYWIIGRIDDVINSGGRRLGIPEIESALLENDKVADTAVVGYPHPIKGSGVYAFVRLQDNAEKSDELKRELVDLVRNTVADFAEIDVIQWIDTLPRTPSGKIIRIILQKIAAGDVASVRDFFTIADPAVVESLVKGRLELVA